MGKKIDKQLQPAPPPDVSDPPTQAEVQSVLDYSKQVSNDMVAANVYNPPPPIMTGTLFTGASSFSFETDALPFTVEQGGVTSNINRNRTVQAITGVTDASEITITLDENATYFKFKNDTWLSINLKSLGDITTLKSSFYNQSSMTTFQCNANTSKVTDFSLAWAQCSALTSFPNLDVSSGTNFNSAWSGCSSLTSLGATGDVWDFRFSYKWV